VWTDTDRSTELVERYNKQFNNIAPRRFDGSHLTLPGVSLRFKLHPHQLRAIWRMVQTGNTYLAHAVGAGKTIEMIAGGMEQKRLGLIKKPIYVVPNHMLEQFSNEFMELYPMANIMVADDENFSPERRKAFVAAATLNSPDAIVITHDAFQRIGVKEESVAPIRDEILTDLEIELSETAKNNETRVRRGQLEQQIEAVKQRFDRIIGAGAKDSTVKFEDMGVDFVFADEAHVFRKLDFHTAQQIKGIDPNGSKRALDMYVKTRILDGRKPGRSMVFASGTPVTNTMGELYTIMRFFAGDALDKAGISTFDAWARQFGEVAPALEPNAAGKYELIERFAKFDNVPELMSRVRQFMDVLTSDNLGALVKRPDIKGGKPNLNITAPNKALQEYMKVELARRIDISKAWKPSKEEPSNPDPIVAIITDGRFAALDPRFFGGKLEEGETSLLIDMGKGVVESYHATKDNVYQGKDKKDEPIKGSTQLVFYNLGFGEQSQKNRGFNSRAAFTKILTDGGIPRGEIYWFDDANTDAKKEAVFKDVRNGKVKVLIGSAKKMGTGVNVQKRLAVLHYQDPPWFPADVEQPHGRIIRQGNQNAEGAIEWYTTKGTYQSTMWQMVARKQRFIDQAFSGDKNLRSMDDLGEASLFEQAAAVASGDPRAIQLAGLRQDVERFERLQASHASEQINVASSLRSAQWGVDSAKKRIATYTKAFAAIGERYFAFSEGKVGNATYTKPGEFGQAIKDAFNNTAADAVMAEKPVKDKPIAAIGDAITIYMDQVVDSKGEAQPTFDLSVSFGGMTLDMGNASAMGADVDATGLARRIFNQINSVDQDLRRAKEDLVRNEVDMNKLRKKLGAPFEYQQEMAEKYAELKRLEAELRAEGAAPATPAKAAITTDDTLTPQAEGGSTNIRQTGAPEDNTDDVAFSRTPAAAPADSNARNVATQLLVDGLKAKWTRAPEIIVARNMQDRQIPQAVRDYDQTLKSQGATGEARGFIYKGKVYLLSDQLKGPQQIAEVLFHEVLGHYGLRGAFGDSLDTILRQMGTMRRRDVVAKAREYGLFDKDALGVDPEQASNRQIWDAMTAQQRLEAAEEVLAEMAQTQPNIGFVKRAIAAIRNWLRSNVPGFKNLRLTDADIIQAYILPARGFVTRSKETGAQSLERAMAAFSRTPGDQTQTEAFKRWFGDSKVVDADGKPLVVYHGTGADISVFDAGKIGSTWGADTEGFFFTSDAREASGYAESNGPTMQRHEGGNVMPVYLSIQRPVTIQALEEFTGETDLSERFDDPINLFDEMRDDIQVMLLGNVQDGWYIDKDSKPSKTNSHDGVLFEVGGKILAVAVDPTQIKSATGNNGQFDPSNADIRFSRSTLGNTMLSRTQSQTDTPEFKRWFGDSKVVDDQGRPLVVYHGTRGDISVFDYGRVKSRFQSSEGLYFTARPLHASVYADGVDNAANDFDPTSSFAKPVADGANVMPVYVSLQNPKIISVSEWGTLESAVDGNGGARVRAAKAAGHDGVIVERNAGDAYDGKLVIAFRPEQIKSAIGNNGNFDPANPDIRFSRAAVDGMGSKVGEAIKSVTVANIKQRAGFKATDYLGLGLQALGRRQIVDIYGDMLPLGEYNKLVQQMEADKNEGGAEADQLVTRWAKLPDEGRLADLMHDATLAQIDPAKPYAKGDDKAQYQMLLGRFNALSDEAKQVYADTRNAYQAHHAKVRSAIKERIERSELKGERKKALLEQMDGEFFKAVKGVYFPLARFGQYAVTIKGPGRQGGKREPRRNQGRGRGAAQQSAGGIPARQGLCRGPGDAFQGFHCRPRCGWPWLHDRAVPGAGQAGHGCGAAGRAGGHAGAVVPVEPARPELGQAWHPPQRHAGFQPRRPPRLCAKHVPRRPVSGQAALFGSDAG